MGKRPLHVGIDGRELLGQATGVGRYLLGFLDVWAADPACAHHFTVFLPASPPATLRALMPRVRVEVAPASSHGTAWEQVELRRMANAAELDVFYAPAYTAPMRLRCPSVLVVHDVSYFAHPEWFPWREGLRRRWLTRRSARSAARVIAVSSFSAREVARYVGLDASRIVIAPGGVPDVDVTAPVGRPPVVLYVGSLLNRRRLPELVAGFAKAAHDVPEARLVLVGANRTHPRQDVRAMALAHGVADRVDWQEYISDEALRGWYRRARVFAFLSDYEGFGMTPFEAIAAGAPAVVLDTPLSREVYGNGARFVAPDATEIGAALSELLQNDALRFSLLAAGRARLARYSWARSAALTLEALESAAGS